VRNYKLLLIFYCSVRFNLARELQCTMRLRFFLMLLRYWLLTIQAWVTSEVNIPKRKFLLFIILSATWTGVTVYKWTLQHWWSCCLQRRVSANKCVSIARIECKLWSKRRNISAFDQQKICYIAGLLKANNNNETSFNIF